MVAIPEGLPLAVSIAMALSINNLKKDKILIKNIESVQTCAMLHDICVGKTGTLTEANMSVEKYQICDQIQTFENDSENDPDYFNTRLEIHEDMKTIIRECIISNTDVRIETNDVEVKYVPKGQALEVGLIQFLIDNEEDIPNMFIQRNQGAVKVIQLPFDQNYKRKVVVRHVEGDSELVRVYVKGAPEYVIPICTQTLDYQVQPIEFTENHYGSILGHVVSNEMAASGLKVLSYAFKELRIGDLEALMQTYNPESEEFRNELESDLIYVCTFGLNDPLRLNVEDAIQSIKFGTQDAGKNEPPQVNIRILTGDHIETAKYVAIKTGLIMEKDRDVAGLAMTGEIFQGAIGGYEKVWDRIHEEFRVDFTNPKMFQEVKTALRVLARATSEDKYVLVAGIKQKGGLVGMTGDSISDAEALKKADVGLCMGSGCDVAKDNSDLVILDNNFVSIYKAVKWGRAIFDNVRKFIQF